MASLTPLSKGLLGLAVVGAMASAVWHLGLKDKWTAAASTAPARATSSAQPEVMVNSPTVGTVPMVQDAKPSSDKLSSAESAELGRKSLDAGDYAKARPYLEAAVQAGDAGSACHLGEMTLKGQGGISASQDKAAALFQLAQSRGAICFASGK